jgi:hypothetical protein
MSSSLRRRVALNALAVTLLAAGASTASGQSIDRDFVVGESGGEIQEPGTEAAFRVIAVFDASSGPSGENPTGTVRIDVVTRFGRSTLLAYNVTCLSVAGNQATIGAVAVSSPPPGTLPANALFYVEDGAGGTRDRTGLLPAPTVPPGCPAPPFDETRTVPSVTGKLTVHDAIALPTAPRQCLGGGWQRYGFASAGKCLAFVIHARVCEVLEQRLGHVPTFCPPTPPAAARSVP